MVPHASSSASQRILVIGPAWIGDMIMTQPLFMRIKQRSPDARIDVLSPEWTLPLLARMPEVSEAIASGARHRELGLRGRFALARTLRARGYDQAIVLPRSFKSALIPYFAGIPRRTGYRGEWRYGLINDVRQLTTPWRATPTAQRNAALAHEHAEAPTPLPQPHLEIDKANRTRAAQQHALATHGPIAVLAPGAEYGPAKQWPAERFAELARNLIAAGWQVWLMGSAKEHPLAEQIRSLASPTVVNLCGVTTLLDAIDLMSLAHVVITNDSGLMHMAVALNRPLIAIYGSTSPTITPLPPGIAQVLYSQRPCSPCSQRTCPLGHYGCLHDIRVEDVIQRLPKLNTAR